MMIDFPKWYPSFLYDVYTTGHQREARGKKHRAKFNVVVDSHAIPEIPRSHWFGRRFAIAELMSYVCGWDDVAWLARFNKNIAQFSDNGVSFNGAYGPRINASIGTVLKNVRDDLHTRQAVLHIFRNEDLEIETKDIPCNTSFQLQSVNGTLNMTIYQRSCDLVWGFPYDHFSFSAMLYLLAVELGLSVGITTRFIANAHVYLPNEYQSESRIQAAMEPMVTDLWVPKPNSWRAFHIAAQEARYLIEGHTLEDSIVEGTEFLLNELGFSLIMDESLNLKTGKASPKTFKAVKS